MEKEFVSYEQAVAVIKLGFREPTLRGWDKIGDIWYHPDSDVVVDNPTKSQVFRWFREKYGLIGWVEGKRVYRWCIESPIPADGQLNFSPFKTYEEAENACIDKLIEIAKQQDK